MILNQDTLHQIINSIADPIFVKDRDHHWVLLNDACCQFIGHPREKLLGKSDYDFFPKKEADVFRKKDEEVFKTGRENLNEENFTDAKGVVHTILTKKRLYKDSSGSPFIVGIIRDITDRKKAEQSVVELTRSEAEREQLELFAYVASHDLREPLQAIIGFSDLLKNRYSASLDEHGHGYLKRVQDAANRMSRLIDDLLKFSRVVKRSELFARVDLAPLIKGILEDLELQIQKNGAKVQLGPLGVIYGDESQIHQLFQNLISNAIKFHLPGKSPVIVIHSLNLDETHLEVAVEDNGIGIETQYWERIFRPFERLHNHMEFEGNGIGLAICEKIATYHEGRIRVESLPGRGSTFYVVLRKFQPSAS